MTIHFQTQRDASSQQGMQAELDNDLAQWKIGLETLFAGLSDKIKTNNFLSEEEFGQWEQFQVLDQQFQTWFEVNLAQLQVLAAERDDVRADLHRLNRIYTDIITLCQQYRDACHQDRQQTRKQVSGASAYQSVQKINQRF